MSLAGPCQMIRPSWIMATRSAICRALTMSWVMEMAVADAIGVFGGYLIAVYKLGFNSSTYIKNTLDFVTTLDVASGLVKAAVFGFVIALMGCYNGYHSRGGAQGVGAATTNAVVSASILILVLNYMLTEAFFSR